MKVVVLGSSGYIGNNLLDKLKELGIEAIGGGRSSELHVDITNKDDVKKLAEFDVIYHLAAISSPRKSIEDLDKTWKVNVEGTKNVAESLREGQTLIFLSTGQVYKPKEGKISERDPLEPRNFYAMTKLIGEELIKFYSKQRGFKYIIFRTFNVYSIDQPAPLIIHDVLKKYKEGGKIKVIDPEATLDFIHMEDAINVLKDAYEFEEGIYNLCSSHPTKIIEVYHAIRDYLRIENVEEEIVSDRKFTYVGDNTKLLKRGYSFRRFKLP